MSVEVKIKAINNNVAVEMLEDKEESSGLIIPGVVKKTQRWGIIKSVGPGVVDLKGTVRKPEVAEGDLVYIAAHGQNPIHFDSTGGHDRLVTASVMDILVKMKNKEKLKLQPLGAYIEIEKIDLADSETSNLVMIDTQKFPTNIGRVITVGTGFYTIDGNKIPFHVKPGDIIVYHPLQTMVIDFSFLGSKEVRYLIMHHDIHGIVEDHPMLERIKKSAK